MYTISPIDANVLIHGRTSVQEPLPLFWTGSGVEFVTDAVSLALDFETDFAAKEQWVRIEVDGTALLPQGQSRLWVWRNMSSAARHRVRLYKELQPMPRDQRSLLYLCGIHCDGKLYPIPSRPIKIEFVGDSLTAGEGLGGASTIQDGISAVFSTEHHYAVETAKRLNADFRILAQSGWGVYVGWDNDPSHTMPRIYESICGVLPSLPQAAAPHDFRTWQPDIIVVHLANNDGFALREPPFTDMDGKTYKLNAAADRTPDVPSLDHVADSVAAFLHKLRRRNPKAQIVWAYGMLGAVMLSAICEGLRRYEAQMQEHIELVILPEMQPKQLGANHHPGAAAHLAAADVLAEALAAHIKETGCKAER